MAKRIIACIAILACCALIFSVSYIHNTYHKLAEQYSRQAHSAFNAGEYEKAIEYARLAEENAALSRAYIDKMARRQSAEEAIEQARERIEWARGINAERDFPAAFSAAVSSYDKAKAAFDKEDYDAAIRYAQEVLASLENLHELIPVPDYTDALSLADNARTAAIEAGADKLGNAFEVTEQKYKEALDAAENGDAGSLLEDVAMQYNALENYAKALVLKKQIDSEKLADYDKTNYDIGEKAMTGLDAMFGDPNSSSKELLDRSKTALDAYTKVLSNASKQRATNARLDAVEAKRRVDSVMAGVTQKQEYASSVEQIILGDDSFRSGDADTANTYYIEAKNRLDALYAKVSELRARADAAVESAKKSVAASAQYALEADINTPIIDENQPGIEKPDAILIEMETYDDPKSAEIDIPDSIS